MSRKSTMEGEKKRRRKFDKEFKVQAVKLLLESGKTVEEVVADLGRLFSNIYRYRIPIPPFRAQGKYLLVQGKGSPKGYLAPSKASSGPLRDISNGFV